MKRIAWLTSYGGQLFNPENNIDESPNCFGSELALVEVGRRLGRFANIDVFISKPAGYSFEKWNINWKSSEDWDKYLSATPPHIIVVCRYMNIFIDYYLPPTAKIMVWAHDPYYLPQHMGQYLEGALMKNVEPFIDHWITVGKYQMEERLMPNYKLDSPKYTAIRNGITLETGYNPMTLVRKPLSFVWCSCPTRGLWTFLEQWKTIKTIFPAATLTIYYTKSEESKKKFQPYEGDTSIDYVGKVSQSILFEKLKTTDYWLYWCNNFESCCTTAMEMAYYGPIAITNAVGGLKENVVTDGLIRACSDPYNVDLFYNMAIHFISRLENNPSEKMRIRQQQFDWSLGQTWDARLPQWREILEL
jgi:hypothetical protein